MHLAASGSTQKAVLLLVLLVLLSVLVLCLLLMPMLMLEQILILAQPYDHMLQAAQDLLPKQAVLTA